MSLVSTEWLKINLANPEIVVLDATIKKVGGIDAAENLRTLRIPGALFFDLKQVFIDLNNPLPNTMPTPEIFENGCRNLGINSESLVVVYDKHGVYSSPRAWWLFKAMGHANVAVLNGGLPSWIAEGYENEQIEQQPVGSGNFTADYITERFCNSHHVNIIRNQDDYLILDARSEGRFFGVVPEPRDYLRSGHIPNSKSLPYSKIVKDGKFLPPCDLKDIFDEINPDRKKLVFSCGSGITACVIALGAEIAGHELGTVYDGSWSDWGMSSELPVSIEK